MSPFLLIAVIKEPSLTLTDHWWKIPRKKQRSNVAVAENNLVAPSKLTLTTIFATVAHFRMLHGDVVSQKHGPGVNFFATEGRRFWVTSKSPAFGYKDVSYCD